MLAIAILVFSITGAVLAADPPVQQDITGQMTDALKGVALPDTGTNTDKNTQLIIGSIINSFLGLFGVFFLVLVIYGGYKWMNARGNQEEIEKAKGILRSAIIGFILVFLAYAISAFVTTALRGAGISSK